MSVLDIDYSNL